MRKQITLMWREDTCYDVLLETHFSVADRCDTNAETD